MNFAFSSEQSLSSCHDYQTWIDDDLLCEIYSRSSLEVKIKMLQARPHLINHAAIDPDELIESIDYKKDYQDEALEAARSHGEPAYAKTLSYLLAAKINKFSKEKLVDINSSVHLTKHAYALLFAMKAYYSAAINRCRHVATFAAVNSSWDPTWYIARYFADSSARNASSYAAMYASCNAVYSLAIDLDHEDFNDPINDEASAIACDAARNGRTPQEVGRIAHRVAEKVYLIYVLKIFNSELEKIYQASMVQMDQLPEFNIFESFEVWSQFKSKHFDHLRDDARLFLRPWICALDHVALKIESRS